MDKRSPEQHVLKRLTHLKIMNIGWEGGKTTILSPNGVQYRVSFGQAGGMGVVLPQLPDRISRSSVGFGMNWDIFSVVPLFTDLLQFQSSNGTCNFETAIDSGIILPLDDVTISYNGGNYCVKVWHLPNQKGTDWYLLEQPETWGAGKLASHEREGGQQEWDIYDIPSGESSFPSGVASPQLSTNHGMARFQRIRYLLFCKAAARVFTRLQADLVLAHDYHSALVPFFINREQPKKMPVPQLLIGHNLGYQGIDTFFYPDTEEPQLAVHDHRNWEKLYRHYGDLLGLKVSEIKDFFIAWQRKSGGDRYLGTPNWLQAALRYNYYSSALAATTVSQNYARQLAVEDRDYIVSRSRKEGTDEAFYYPHNCAHRLKRYFDDHTGQDDIFFPNKNLQGLKSYHIQGVLNGMSPEDRHLRYQTGFLLRILREAYASGLVVEAEKVAAGIFHCGSDLKSSELLTRIMSGEEGLAAGLDQQFPPRQRIHSSEVLTQIRSLARKLLFRHPYLQGLQDQDQAVHFSWGRLVNQKSFQVLAEEIEHITCDRNEILIILASAPVSDIEGREIERRLKKANGMYKNFVFINVFDPSFRDLCLLACSVVHLVSLYEPCGLTDIETYWFGGLAVVHNTGGLLKGAVDEKGYTQIQSVYPEGEPVAAIYSWYDNTDPVGEAREFRKAYTQWLDRLNRNSQLEMDLRFKALNLLEFDFYIPLKEYICLIVYTWIGSLWRHYKDSFKGQSTSKMISFLKQNFFNCGTLGNIPMFNLFRNYFVPPKDDDGNPLLRKDSKKDHALYQILQDSVD